MDLKRLKHLVALADTRNFSRAAERMHLTQPAFSRSVQAAEAEMGLQLFDRDTREVTCTVAGTFVIERARKLLFESRCLERDVSLYRERLIGDVAFGMGPFPAVILLPELMIELRTRFAGIYSRVQVSNWRPLLAFLRAEELEFFLSHSHNIPRDPDLAITNIGRLNVSFYARAGHPLLRGKRLKAAEMAPFGIACGTLPKEGRAYVQRMLDLGQKERLPISVECDDVHLLKRIALSTDTVLMSVDDAVREEVAAGRLCRLVLRDVPPNYFKIGIVSLVGRTFSPVAEYATDYLRQLIAERKD
jgi:DNA-binding transcriptional LysR family regulator